MLFQEKDDRMVYEERNDVRGQARTVSVGEAGNAGAGNQQGGIPTVKAALVGRASSAVAHNDDLAYGNMVKTFPAI